MVVMLKSLMFLSKKETPAQTFSFKFAKFLRATFLQNTLG